MESGTLLYRVYIPNKNKTIFIRRDDLKIIRNESLPGMSALLDGILRQLE